MREGMDQPGSMTFDSHWKNIECWVRANNVVFCRGYNVPVLFWNLQMRSFACKECDTPNTLPTTTLVHGQVTWHPPLRGLLLFAIRGCTDQLWVFEPRQSSAVLSIDPVKTWSFKYNFEEKMYVLHINIYKNMIYLLKNTYLHLFSSPARWAFAITWRPSLSGRDI